MAALKNVLLPTILVLAGILLLALSRMAKTGGKITLSGKQKIASIAIGVLLLLFGISLFLSPSVRGGFGTTSAPTILGITIRHNREEAGLVIYERINFYDEDGNTNLVERELIDLSDPSQRDFIQVQDSQVNDPPEVQKIRSSLIESWNCEGHVYVATIAVTLVDSDGNRSNPVRYTLDCN